MITIFWNIVQVSLTTSVVLVPLLFLCTMLRRRYPVRAVCVLWLLFAIRLLIPVQITWEHAPIQVVPRTTLVQQEIQQEDSTPTHKEQAEQITHTRWMIQPSGMETYATTTTIEIDWFLAWIWISGVVILGVREMGAYSVLRKRIKETAQTVEDVRLLQLYAQETALLSRKPALYQSVAVAGPMLIGIFHPAIILPQTGISATDASFIFQHELMHYRYKDLIYKLILIAARCIHWWNPVIHFLVLRSTQDLEIACDQAVVRGMDWETRRRYGHCILQDAARNTRRRHPLTTQLTTGGKVMKTRIQELFYGRTKRSATAMVLTICFVLTLVGSCFALNTASAQTSALAQEALEIAEKYLQARLDDDMDTVQSMTYQSDEAWYHHEIPTSPKMTGYVVVPDSQTLWLRYVANWSETGHSDTHSIERLHLVRQDGTLKVQQEYNAFTLWKQVRDLDTFTMLYGVLGLPKIGEMDQPQFSEEKMVRILDLAGGQVNRKSENQFVYTFFNGQAVSIFISQNDDGWQFDHWETVQKTPVAADATTVAQMEQLSKQWCDFQIHGVTKAQANQVFGSALLTLFEESIIETDDPEQRMSIDNLRSEVIIDQATYEVDAKEHTAEIHIHGVPENRRKPQGMTQTQKLFFGWENGQLKIVDRIVTQALELDQPNVVYKTARDVIRAGMPKNPIPETTAQKLVYSNFLVIGGHCVQEDHAIRYVFADGTSVRFSYEEANTSPSEERVYILKGISRPEGESIRSSKMTQRYRLANQWAEGYLHKNGMYQYPAMSQALQQQFIIEQEQAYGLTWFWRIGWGSSPSVIDWTITECTDDEAVVQYDLMAGGEHFRYAERLYFARENGDLVIRGWMVEQELTYDKSER